MIRQGRQFKSKQKHKKTEWALHPIMKCQKVTQHLKLCKSPCMSPSGCPRQTKRQSDAYCRTGHTPYGPYTIQARRSTQQLSAAPRSPLSRHITQELMAKTPRIHQATIGGTVAPYKKWGNHTCNRVTVSAKVTKPTERHGQLQGSQRIDVCNIAHPS